MFHGRIYRLLKEAFEGIKGNLDLIQQVGNGVESNYKIIEEMISFEATLDKGIAVNANNLDKLVVLMDEQDKRINELERDVMQLEDIVNGKAM